jgi:hypothetical protein
MLATDSHAIEAAAPRPHLRGVRRGSPRYAANQTTRCSRHPEVAPAVIRDEHQWACPSGRAAESLSLAYGGIVIQLFARTATVSVRVKLSEIVDGMEMQSDEMAAYLQRSTGRVVVVSDEALHAAEDDDDGSAEAEELADERGVLAGDTDYVALPDRFEIDEYRMMERFAAGIEDARVREAALRSLHGAGAFGRFKDTMHRYALAPAWYAYRDGRYAEVAQTWCEINGIDHDSLLADT